jgi:hypothetical protein
MPLGTFPNPLPFTPNGLLSDGVVTGYRFELLDGNDDLVDELQTVEGGGLDWSAFTAIKGSGTLDVVDDGTPRDWLNLRIRPVVLLQGYGLTTEVPCGIFIPAAPKESWNGSTRRWGLELLDKLSILDQDIVTDENGDPVFYVAPVGANIVELVVNLIQGVGEATPAIEPDSPSLAASQVWEVGTPVLKIVNDLLEIGGFTSLYLDPAGNYRIARYLSPGQRDPIYSAQAPFVVGPRSVLDPEWERDRDVYSIPNRYVAIGMGSGDEEAPVAVVTNTDVSSPYSFQSRGRWITRVVTGVEASSQVELETRALMGLAQSASVTSGLYVTHRFLPDLTVNSTIRFTHPDAELDLLTYVTKTSLSFDSVGLCKSEIREAIV